MISVSTERGVMGNIPIQTLRLLLRKMINSQLEIGPPVFTPIKNRDFEQALLFGFLNLYKAVYGLQTTWEP